KSAARMLPPGFDIPQYEKVLVAFAQSANSLVPSAFPLGVFQLQPIVSMLEKPRNLSFIISCVILRFKFFIKLHRVLTRRSIAFCEVHHFLLGLRERDTLPLRLPSSLLYE